MAVRERERERERERKKETDTPNTCRHAKHVQRAGSGEKGGQPWMDAWTTMDDGENPTMHKIPQS